MKRLKFARYANAGLALTGANGFDFGPGEFGFCGDVVPPAIDGPVPLTGKRRGADGHGRTSRGAVSPWLMKCSLRLR